MAGFGRNDMGQEGVKGINLWEHYGKMIRQVNIVGLFILLLCTLTSLLMPERSDPPAIASPPSTSPPAKNWHWRAGGGQVTHDVSWGGDRPVKIGVLAKRGADRCMEKWSPTAEYLTSRIQGKRFEMVPLDFREIYVSVENGGVDFILANPSIYIELENRYSVNRIATLKNLCLGRACTKLGGVIFCRADRKDIKSLKDVRGKSFMSLDESALGAWIAVRREFKEEGIDPYYVSTFTILEIH